MLPFHAQPILELPTYGSLSAQRVVEHLGIRSPKDESLLTTAKEMLYQKAFYEGKMLVGPYVGRYVQLRFIETSLFPPSEAFF